jgi:hypothetical protein
MDNQKPQRISNLIAWILIFLALGFDLLALAAGFIAMDWFVGWVAWFFFLIVFYFKGISFIQPKRFGVLAISFIIGSIPFIGALIPELTLAVIATILMVKSEDKLGIKIPSIGKK